ncbi:hypothetical protein FOCC_FOCC014599 [Frankliniella occidentalis]|nr:hypothetical protein FOCC_FOCC014599 [Frankliniella occidentalis]
MWCDTCRKQNPSFSEPNSQETVISLSQASGSTDSSSLSPSIAKEKARQDLMALGLSPLATVSHKSVGVKASAAKRKIEEVQEIVQKRVTRALGVHTEDIKSIEARKAEDHDLLMDEIKKKLPTTSKVMRYQLLSLIPDSMSVNEAAQFFDVSRKLVASAKQLKNEKGILPIPIFSRSSSVKDSTKDLIRDYYCNDTNSKSMPGLRDCVSIKKGVYEQKRLLLSNIPELYKAFKEEKDGIKVGLSMFWSLKPKWCITAGHAGTHEQCICQTHQNFKLITYALDIPHHYRDLIPLCVCNTQDRACMLRICDQCPTVENIYEILRKQIKMPNLGIGVPENELFSTEDEFDFLEETVKFRQWKSADGRTEMVVQLCSRSDLLEMAAKQMSDLIPHDFISCSQRDYVKNLKSDLPSDTVMIAMDFAMNYNCLVQKAVQSYHWSPKQATVHPTVIYHKNSENVTEHKTIIFISDDLEHDVALVRKIQEETVSYLKENLPHIKEIIYCTDGCACQYKSKGYFKNLCTHEAELGLKASHSYFATSHGKSQCDADGGSVKRKARNASLQRPLDNQIISAMDLFDFCIQEMKEKFIFKFITKAEVEPKRRLYHEMMPTLETLPGTRTFHYIKPQTENAIACWRIANDQNERPSLVHSLEKVPKPDSPVLKVSVGKYVVIRMNKNRYVSLVTDVYEEEAEADVTLLMPKLPAKEFSWPNDVKSATVPFPHILCEVQMLDLNGKLYFTENDVQNLYTKRILRKPAK